MVFAEKAGDKVEELQWAVLILEGRGAWKTLKVPVSSHLVVTAEETDKSICAYHRPNVTHHIIYIININHLCHWLVWLIELALLCIGLEMGSQYIVHFVPTNPLTPKKLRIDCEWTVITWLFFVSPNAAHCLVDLLGPLGLSEMRSAFSIRSCFAQIFNWRRIYY